MKTRTIAMALTMFSVLGIVALGAQAKAKSAPKSGEAELPIPSINELAKPIAAPSPKPSLVGTYKLISREMSDGTKVQTPAIMGLLTYTETYRNFNVFWKTPEGRFFSYSVVSTYSFSDTAYSETILYTVLNDQVGGKGLSYDLSGTSLTVPVTSKDGKLEFKLPFDPVTITFEGYKFSAKSPDFTDFWEKVQ